MSELLEFRKALSSKRSHDKFNKELYNSEKRYDREYLSHIHFYLTYTEVDPNVFVIGSNMMKIIRLDEEDLAYLENKYLKAKLDAELVNEVKKLVKQYE